MTWLEGFFHKHTIICLVLAGALLLGWYKWVAHQDGLAHDARVLADAQLKQDQQAQKAADAQAQKDAQAYSALKQQMDSQNAALRSQITALSVALAGRQAQDRALPPSELATRHIQLVGLLPGDVKATPDGILSTLGAERSTVVMLEEVPSLRQTVKNQDGIIANDKQELGSIQTALNSANAATEACKVTQKQQEETCKAQISEVKAKARKHGFWYALGAFLGGVFAGSRL